MTTFQYAPSPALYFPAVGRLDSQSVDVLRRHNFEVVAALAGEDTGITLLRIESTDLLDILADVRGQPDVVDADLLWKRERTALV